MSKRLIAMLAGVVAIAAIAAGCGSSDDDSTEGAASLTKAEFIKQGDAICEKGNDEIQEGFESFAKQNDIPENEEPTKEQTKELVETVILPSLETQSEEIQALAPPSDDEDEISSMLDSLDEGIEEAEDDPETLFSGETDPFGPANEKAKQYGLKVCGQQ